MGADMGAGEGIGGGYLVFSMLSCKFVTRGVEKKKFDNTICGYSWANILTIEDCKGPSTDCVIKAMTSLV